MLWVSGSAGYVALTSEINDPEVRLCNVLDIKGLGLLQFGNNTVQVIFKGESEMC